VVRGGVIAGGIVLLFIAIIAYRQESKIEKF